MATTSARRRRRARRRRCGEAQPDHPAPGRRRTTLNGSPPFGVTSNCEAPVADHHERGAALVDAARVADGRPLGPPVRGQPARPRRPVHGLLRCRPGKRIVWLRLAQEGSVRARGVGACLVVVLLLRDALRRALRAPARPRRACRGLARSVGARADGDPASDYLSVQALLFESKTSKASRTVSAEAKKKELASGWL